MQTFNHKSKDDTEITDTDEDEDSEAWGHGGSRRASWEIVSAVSCVQILMLGGHGGSRRA